MLSLSVSQRLIFPLMIILSLVWLPKPAQAQTAFSSGSTGANGAFSANANQTVQVPDSGVFNFTTVDIPVGITVTFARNAKNTPVTILATGNVTIAGAITVSGLTGNANGGGGAGGPGGFNGGAAGFGFDAFAGQTGDGPGGGGGGGSTNGAAVGGGGGGGFAANGGNATGTSAGQGGPKYGANTLLPLIGGSGGGGGGAFAGNHTGAGGGGGGAILIASSTTITFTGTINASGGNGVFSSNAGGGGGGGAGGAIRFVANTITGAGTLNVTGGSLGASGSQAMNGGAGSPGYVRIEATNFSSFNPTVPTGSITFAQPNPVTVPNAPTLRIVSIAGVAAPAATLGSFSGVPDIVLPASQANPVSVVIEATNVPVGTVIQVTLIPSSGTRTTVQSGPLSGTQAASSATASVSLGTGMSVLTAAATIDVSTTAMNMLINGERVDRIEIAAVYGRPSQVTYITRTGRRIAMNE